MDPRPRARRPAAPALAAALACGAALAWPAAARPCSVCTPGDPTMAVSEGPGRGGDLRLGLDAEFLTQSSGSESTPGATDALDQYTLRLTAVYSPYQPVNLVVVVPWLRKRMTMEHADGSTMPMSDVSGLGDAEVSARWFVLEKAEVGAGRLQGLALTLGTALPTGRTGARDAAGQPVDAHGQVGTGAFGPAAGLTWRLQQSPWSLSASLTGRLRTANGDGYRVGHALLWTLQGQWTPRGWLALGLALDGRSAGADRQDGQAVANTGGVVLAATPSAYLQLRGPLWLTARAQLPVATSLPGAQRVGPAVLAGLAWQVE